MTVFLIVSIIMVAGLAIAVILGRFGHAGLQMDPPVSSAGGWLPPQQGELTSEDLDDVRFDVVLRGYRMDQVDALLARMRAELDRRDDQAFEAALAERPRTYPFPGGEAGEDVR